MKKLVIVFVVIFMAVGAYSLVFADPGDSYNRRDYDSRRGMMRGDYGRGGYYQEDMHELREKIYEKYEDMIENNRDKIRDIMDKKYDLRRDIQNEMEKSNPDWGKIESLMNRNHSYSEDIWKIRKDERLEILKSLTEKERDLYMEHSRGFSGRHGGYRGFHRGFRRGGRHRGHMGY
ncbi:MAG: hypothetical protein FXF47_05550 [Candidatus Mcinerneyibacterium aminivorans]|uniref:Periplasmic heavy metal sensor n=1 Tax=Candidatus Mcinerneyibacterium aminivorans TaxID=2703815 RepID=A0A5D0MDU9_9BACT|nr:MAG: hypothetical protein FXF47_05550 [Candidatus Mcinerneyibacterium aminivorans]